MLKFSRGNAKLGKHIHTFSLNAGYTCPFAKDCLSKAIPDSNGKRAIQDGKYTVFRCFSASTEVMYNDTWKARLHNTTLLKKCRSAKAMIDLLTCSLPKKAKIVRIHVSGDFFNQRYFDAWLQVADNNPHILFYAYTKSLKFWVKRLKKIPKNFRLTASVGGKLDYMIEQHGLKYAQVVYSIQEAENLGLEIDHDDSHAYQSDKSFALLIHGVQPKDSMAARAMKALDGKSGYSKNKLAVLAA